MIVFNVHAYIINNSKTLNSSQFCSQPTLRWSPSLAAWRRRISLKLHT